MRKALFAFAVASSFACASAFAVNPGNLGDPASDDETPWSLLTTPEPYRAQYQDVYDVLPLPSTARADVSDTAGPSINMRQIQERQEHLRTVAEARQHVNSMMAQSGSDIGTGGTFSSAGGTVPSMPVYNVTIDTNELHGTNN